MRRFLWISGVLAVIAIVAPSLVVLGLYLGILPGLVLAAAPTVFLYARRGMGMRCALRGAPRHARRHVRYAFRHRSYGRGTPAVDVPARSEVRDAWPRTLTARSRRDPDASSEVDAEDRFEDDAEDRS